MSELEQTSTPEISHGGESAPEVAAPISAAPPTEGQLPTPEAPAFTPSYKVKVMDQEKEIDPMFRGLIKDQETQKKVQEIFERAYGHEYLKPKYEQMKEKSQSLEQVQTEYQTVQENIGQLSHMLKSGDMGGFFEAIQVPKESIFRWVRDELKKAELPPEQRQALEERDRFQKENRTTTSQMERMQKDWEATQVQMRELQMQQAISTPDIRSVQEEFDARVGTPGAFRQAVIKEGRQAFLANGEDITVEQAVQQVVNNAKLLMGIGSQTSAPQTPAVIEGTPMIPVNGKNVVAAPNQQATIPVVKGRGTSPVKASPRSLEEIRKLAQTM